MSTYCQAKILSTGREVTIAATMSQDRFRMAFEVRCAIDIDLSEEENQEANNFMLQMVEQMKSRGGPILSQDIRDTRSAGQTAKADVANFLTSGPVPPGTVS